MTQKTIALAGAMLAALAWPASAGEGPYLGLEAGWSRPNNLHFYNVNVDGQYLLDDSGLYGVTAGYKWAKGIRLELELSHAKYAASHSDAFGFIIPATGHIRQTALMGNLAYDIPITDRLGFTAGGGVGAARVSTEIYGDFDATGDDTAFAWQALAGLTWKLSDRFDLQLDYRYRSVADTQHWVTNPCGCTNDTNFSDDASHSVMVGVRWYLYAAAAPLPPAVLPPPPPPLPLPPPPPPPLPPPPPPPPPAVTTFIIFFDFNKSNLTAEAQQVIQQAVTTAMTNGRTRVLITGHTDTVGSLRSNQALSERRAEAVKNEMIREGMNADEIMTVGRNFADPLVPTDPGVREPQNRRAVIDIGAELRR